MWTFKFKQPGPAWLHLRQRKVKRFAAISALLFLIGLALYSNLDTVSQGLTPAFLSDKVDGQSDLRETRVLTSTKQCPDQKLTLPLITNKYFQEIKPTETAIYSAYADGNRVRLIAIRRHTDKIKLFCHLWYYDVIGEDPLEVVPAKVESLPENHGEQFTAAYIFCTLPDKRKNSLPVAVNIVPTKCQKTSHNALPVLQPAALTSNFTVCVTPLNNKYDRVHELVEMIEFNRLLGADKIAFYNYSTHPMIDKVLRHYEQQGMVEVFPWNLPSTKIHYYGQLASLNDCLHQHRYSSQYLVYQDLDEFIIPQGSLTSWGELIERRRRRKPKAAVFQIKNVFFRREWTKTWPKFPFNEKAIKYRSVILRTIIKEFQVLPYNHRSKYILDPQRVSTVGIHFVWETSGGVDHVPQQEALLCHYRNWQALEDRQKRLEDASVVERYGQKIVDSLDHAWTDLERTVGLKPGTIS